MSSVNFKPKRTAAASAHRAVSLQQHGFLVKFTQNSLVVLIPYLLIYSQQCFVTTLLRHIAFMRNVFCFIGFNQAAIVLR